MKRTPILVCSDAGAAGRVMLARRDLDVRWALTLAEARAVIDSGFPSLVITREDLALPVLEHLQASANPRPSIVLLEADGWLRSEAYFARGATALARESASARILEAISELTGLQFAQHPRVPYATVVDAQTPTHRHFAESIDISASGITLRGLEAPEVGAVYDLQLVMLEPPLALKAMVVRTFEDQGEPIAGLCFLLSDDDVARARLVALVDEERRRQPRLPDPSNFAGELGAYTLDLEQALSAESNPNAAYRALLKDALGNEAKQASVPAWLRRLAETLSPCERGAVLGEPVPAWGLQAVDLRITLGRHRLDAVSEATSRDDAKQVIDLACALSVGTEHESPAMLLEICEVRASLLRDVYGSPSKHRDGRERSAGAEKGKRAPSTRSGAVR